MYVKSRTSIASRTIMGLAAIACAAASLNTTLFIFAISGTAA